ncbi:hypothetical protein [Jannaschia sp. R86511]|uniref:hypothetical protein n=1 Tax=Jannaschia sp. R86511 TaxID=3093853 RepID=UPI0036D41705
MPAPRSSGDDFDRAWQRALDDLELDVERAEAVLRDSHLEPGETAPTVTWTPPRLTHPLPDSMRERAERILERQLALAGRLATAMTSSRRHLDVVERIVPSDPHSRPMYVDQAL